MLQKIKTFFKVVGLIILVIGSFVSTFWLGMYVKELFYKSQPLPKPIVVIDPNPVKVEATSPKDYYEDTLYVAIDSTPRSYFIVTATRSPSNQKYSLITRISYFNGVRWTRDTLDENVNSPQLSEMKDMGYLKYWNIQDNPSKMLQEKIDAQFAWELNKLELSTNTLENEMGIKSKPSYTKFMSNGTGTVAINDKKYSAKIVSSRTYSMNSDEIQFYDNPLGITTFWMIFWTEDGSFYHLDQTQVNNPTPLYTSHKIGVLKTPVGGVFKTFSTTAARQRIADKDTFIINLNDPINVGINLTGVERLNKLSKNTTDWFMEAVQGTVTDRDGVPTGGYGLVEYLTEI